MMEAEELELLIQNNHLIFEMVQELREIKKQLARPQADTDLCTPEEALVLLGVNNVRYLTYFSGPKGGYLLHRRKGGLSYMYFKNECIALAAKIKSGDVKLVNTKEMYLKHV